MAFRFTTILEVKLKISFSFLLIAKKKKKKVRKKNKHRCMTFVQTKNFFEILNKKDRKMDCESYLSEMYSTIKAIELLSIKELLKTRKLAVNKINLK